MEQDIPAIGTVTDPNIILQRSVGYYFRSEPPESRWWTPTDRKLKFYTQGKIYEFERGGEVGTMSWPMPGNRKYYQKGDIIFIDSLTPREWSQVVPKWNAEEKNELETLMGVLLIVFGVCDIFPERYIVGWKIEEVEWNAASQKGAAILRPRYKVSEGELWIELPFRLRFSQLELNRFFLDVLSNIRYRSVANIVEFGIQQTVDIGILAASGGSAKTIGWASKKGMGLFLVKIFQNAGVRKKFAFKFFKMLNKTMSKIVLKAAKSALKSFIKDLHNAKELQRFRSDSLTEAQWKKIMDKAFESFAKAFVEELFDVILTKSHYKSVGVLFANNMKFMTMAKKILREFIIDLHVNFISKELVGLAVKFWNNPADIGKGVNEIPKNLVGDGVGQAKSRIAVRYVNKAIDPFAVKVSDFTEKLGVKLIDTLFEKLRF